MGEESGGLFSLPTASSEGPGAQPKESNSVSVFNLTYSCVYLANVGIGWKEGHP